MALPPLLMLLQQYRKVLAHVAGTIENAVQKPGTIPKGLPTQGAVAFVVDAFPFTRLRIGVMVEQPVTIGDEVADDEAVEREDAEHQP